MNTPMLGGQAFALGSRRRPAPATSCPRFEERTAYGYKRQDPYAKLFEDRIIFLGVQVDDASADDIMAQLLVLESQDPDRDIVMYINSPGGSFTAMTAIYDTMQYIRPQIQTVVLGQAASAAAVLTAAGTPGKRLALPNARILIHQPAVGEAGQGQASDIEIQAAEILRMRTWLEETLSQALQPSRRAGEQGHRPRQDPERGRGPRVRPDRPGADQPQERSRRSSSSSHRHGPSTGGQRFGRTVPRAPSAGRVCC